MVKKKLFRSGSGKVKNKMQYIHKQKNVYVYIVDINFQRKEIVRICMHYNKLINMKTH